VSGSTDYRYHDQVFSTHAFIFNMLSSNFSPQAHFPDKVFCTLLIHCLQVNSGIIQVQPDSSIS